MNRMQLKLLAVAAMLIDHLAWAFVPLGTPLAQGMHTVGRLTARQAHIMWNENFLAFSKKNFKTT